MHTYAGKVMVLTELNNFRRSISENLADETHWSFFLNEAELSLNSANLTNH